MKITKVVVGLLEENCYVLEKDKQVIVVDPGDEYERIKKVIGHKKVAGVLITHNHFDHVGALEEFDPSLVYKYDNLEEGEHTIGPFNFEVIYTPGHTKDSVSYYFKEDNILFDGDFVFCLGIGRCDLDDGDYKEMMRSIEKIKKYPKDMIALSHMDIQRSGRNLSENKVYNDCHRSSQYRTLHTHGQVDRNGGHNFCVGCFKAFDLYLV